MIRKHGLEFKNRRQQHKLLVDAEWCIKQTERHGVHVTKHSKKRWRKVENFHNKERALEQRANK